jgi:hypothetical protein
MSSQLLPLGITTRQVIELIGSSKLLKRALAAKGWLKPVIQGGRGCSSIFDYQDVLKFWERLKTGERPPLLACEIKTRKLLTFAPADAKVSAKKRAA